MYNEQNTAHFFMGANAPLGFNTFYSELETPVACERSYLIKGGAGTGKSGLMRRVLKECSTTGLIEELHCSSDPDSLDGIILKERHFSMVDATRPHVIEPTYPGGYQTVINLCEYLNEANLEAALPTIIKYQVQNKLCHKRCCDMLHGANLLLSDSAHCIEAQTDFSKISDLANRIIKKEIKSPSKAPGAVHKRLLSAITNQGVKTYTKTPHVLADKIYLIKDTYGVASHAILTALYNRLQALNYEIYACFSPLNPLTGLEHIFVPELSLGFVTANRYNAFEEIKPLSVISYTRFTAMAALQRKKQMLAFNRKAANELISAAISALKDAKAAHDRLERLYSPAVDFEGVNAKAEQIVREIMLR